VRLPRIAHRLYARLAGYFWIACPLCGREFGGHERAAGWPSVLDAVPSGKPGTGRAICPRCTAAGYGCWPLDEEVTG
jgi:hypothetical protein